MSDSSRPNDPVANPVHDVEEHYYRAMKHIHAVLREKIASGVGTFDEGVLAVMMNSFALVSDGTATARIKRETGWMF